MMELRQLNANRREQSSRVRPGALLNLFRNASSKTLTRMALAVATAWIPLAILSAFRGGAAFRSFLTDYASQTRFLLVIPVLILAEPNVRASLTVVAQEFETFMIPHDQQAIFRKRWERYVRLQDSKIFKLLLVVLTYTTATWLGQYLSPTGSEFGLWWRGAGGFRSFSRAGTWAFFVSYAILIYLTYLWLWGHLLWLKFLHFTTRLKLKLIAAHPDNLGGLGFVEGSLRAQLAFSFCMGVGLAGAIANRVFHGGQNLPQFRHLALILIGTVLLLCVAHISSLPAL